MLSVLDRIVDLACSVGHHRSPRYRLVVDEPGHRKISSGERPGDEQQVRADLVYPEVLVNLPLDDDVTAVRL